MEKINNSIEENKKLKLEIKQILSELGIMPHLKGFRYWTTAILYVIELEQNEEELTKFTYIYEYVGRKHKATASKAERVMRYALQGLDLKEKFNVQNSISNSAFLYLVKEKILNKNNVFC